MNIETMLARTSVASLSPVFNKSKNVGVLYFHRILKEKDPFFPDDFTVEEFDALIKVLSKTFNICTLSEIFSKSKTSLFDRPVLSITFDDGYQDNYRFAAKILEKYGVRGNFFVATECVGVGYLTQDLIMQWFEKEPVSLLGDVVPKDFGDICVLNDTRNWRAQHYHDYIGRFKHLCAHEQEMELAKLKSLSTTKFEHHRIMMTRENLVDLDLRGHEIGGHTHSHKILSTLTLPQAKEEIFSCYRLLTEWLGTPPSFFAYPNGMSGDFGSSHADLVRCAGFKHALTAIDGGFAPSSITGFCGKIPRFMPYRRNRLLFALSTLKIMGEA